MVSNTYGTQKSFQSPHTFHLKYLKMFLITVTVHTRIGADVFHRNSPKADSAIVCSPLHP